MKIKCLLAVIAGALALPLQAAELSAQDGVSILYINGQTAEEKIGVNQVDSGFNQVVIRFDEKLGGRNSGSVYTSKPYVLNIDAQGENIKIVAPKLYSESEAEAEFAKAKPGWKVLVDGTSVEFNQEVLAGKEGFLPYSGMDNLLAEHNKQNGIYFKNGQLLDKPVVVEAAMVSTAATAGKVNTAASEVTKATKNVEQLKAWYLQADTQERKEFRRWMIDQE